MPVPPAGIVADDDAAPPIAPASKLKVSNPKVPPTEAPDIDRLLAAGGALGLSLGGCVLEVSPVEPGITLVVVVLGKVGGGTGTAIGRLDDEIFDVAVIIPCVCIL